MIKEHDSVILSEDLPENGLTTGDVGVVIHIYQGGEAYEVEFMTMDGGTVAVVALEAKQVRRANSRMIPHVREMAV